MSRLTERTLRNKLRKRKSDVRPNPSIGRFAIASTVLGILSSIISILLFLSTNVVGRFQIEALLEVKDDKVAKIETVKENYPIGVERLDRHSNRMIVRPTNTESYRSNFFFPETYELTLKNSGNREVTLENPSISLIKFKNKKEVLRQETIVVGILQGNKIYKGWPAIATIQPSETIVVYLRPEIIWPLSLELPEGSENNTFDTELSAYGSTFGFFGRSEKEYRVSMGTVIFHERTNPDGLYDKSGSLILDGIGLERKTNNAILMDSLRIDSMKF